MSSRRASPLTILHMAWHPAPQRDQALSAASCRESMSSMPQLLLGKAQTCASPPQERAALALSRGQQSDRPL
eukprot:CAMPEP_0115828726 /NCGR_PEP_ID=MMETSP0287-20121206/724_1 /TAXON_ID=412157 /ORGANISM="Chrysochromulina rotalis, Strain UIO044" /LENGTH=71 /DNA_ID=CAMNT_0003281955 /DNA_START=701 /DNA_END=917 /DNA_ORIENTATION=-